MSRKLFSSCLGIITSPTSGALNIAVGYVLLVQVGDFELRNPIQVGVGGLGGLIMAVILAGTFGRFHGGDHPEN